MCFYHTMLLIELIYVTFCLVHIFLFVKLYSCSSVPPKELEKVTLPYSRSSNSPPPKELEQAIVPTKRLMVAVLNELHELHQRRNTLAKRNLRTGLLSVVHFSPPARNIPKKITIEATTGTNNDPEISTDVYPIQTFNLPPSKRIAKSTSGEQCAMKQKKKEEKEREKKRLSTKRHLFCNNLNNWNESLEHNREKKVHEHTDQHKQFRSPTTPFEAVTYSRRVHVAPTVLPDREKEESDECTSEEAIFKYLCHQRHARQAKEAKHLFFNRWKNVGKTIAVEPEKQTETKKRRKRKKRKKKKNSCIFAFRNGKRKKLRREKRMWHIAKMTGRQQGDGKHFDHASR